MIQKLLTRCRDDGWRSGKFLLMPPRDSVDRVVSDRVRRFSDVSPPFLHRYSAVSLGFHG